MGRGLDDIDRAILRAFQEDARVSNKELAAKIHLSPSSCHERVKRLHRQGILRGSRAEVSPSVFGISLQALIGTRLRDHTSVNLEAFKAYVLGFDEVVALHHVTGEKDYFLRVAVRDSEHLRELVLKLSARTELERLETFVILDEESRPLPDLT
ncbi:MAG: Lrp/AsnC family transcriptional regulator [Acidobacteriota bacterium]